jgi:hypothetical protein
VLEVFYPWFPLFIDGTLRKNKTLAIKSCPEICSLQIFSCFSRVEVVGFRRVQANSRSPPFLFWNGCTGPMIIDVSDGINRLKTTPLPDPRNVYAGQQPCRLLFLRLLFPVTLACVWVFQNAFSRKACHSCSVPDGRELLVLCYVQHSWPTLPFVPIVSFPAQLLLRHRKSLFLLELVVQPGTPG